jgi:hypothetical protein
MVDTFFTCERLPLLNFLLTRDTASDSAVSHQVTVIKWVCLTPKYHY